MRGLTTPAFTQGYSILVLIPNHPNPDRENQVKSHLAWIYAHARTRVKYKVVPKGEGHSGYVKVEEAAGKHARNAFWVERFISGRTTHWLLVAHNASMHWLCHIGTTSDSLAHSAFFSK